LRISINETGGPLRGLKSLLRSMEPKRFLKFCIVGISGVGVNIGLYLSLTRGLMIYYLFSSAIAIEVSILSNFTLNNFWTFRDRTSQTFLQRMLMFNLICIAGAVINVTMLAVLHGHFGFSDVVSQLVGIAAATLWNYGLNITWTWRP
jgi:dolichol-phosphate mannosyltransferase